MAHFTGRWAEKDMKKARHNFEIAAIGGDVEARHFLGMLEGNAGDKDSMMKHFMIAIEGGYEVSLEKIKHIFMDEHTHYATKDDYAKALRAYQTYIEEIRSDQRDEAAAFRDEYKYY